MKKRDLWAAVGFTLSTLCVAGCANTPHLLEALNGNNIPGPTATETPAPTPAISPSPKIIIESRLVEFATNATEFKPTVKVVLIVDNSPSMKDEQAKLATGVENMIEGLKSQKANVDFLVYTTSSDSNDKPVSHIDSSYVTRDGDGNEIFSAIRPPGTNPSAHSKRESWKLNAPLTKTGFTANSLRVRVSDSDDTYTSVKANLKSLITGIDIKGSDAEQGFCVMGRLLDEIIPSSSAVATNAIFSSGDHVAFVVISDSDDVTNADSCLKQRETNYSIQTQLGAANLKSSVRSEVTRWDYATYFYKPSDTQFYVTYNYSSTVTEDGQVRPAIKSGAATLNIADYGNPPVSGSYANCTAPILSYVQSAVTGYITDSCKYRESYTYKGFSKADSSLLSRNLCSESFVENSITYSNLYDYYKRNYAAELQGYLNNSCNGTGSYGVTPYLQGTQSLSKIRDDLLLPAIASSGTKAAIRAGVVTTPSIQDAISGRASELFGTEGFRFAAIVDLDNDPNDCAGIATESQGKKYREYSESLGSRGSTHSICASSYYPALQGVQTFIDHVMQTAYEIQLLDNEKIIAVAVRRSGSKIPVVLDQDLTIQGKSLRFKEGFLQPNDQIQVSLERTVETN
jgi:hypothetical protein